MRKATARDQLTTAHRSMTPAEIAAHALDLVEVVAEQAELLARYRKLIEAMHATEVSGLAAQRGWQSEVRRVASIFARGKRAEGVTAIRKLAELPMPPDAVPLDATAFPAPPPAALLNPLLKE